MKSSFSSVAFINANFLNIYVVTGSLETHINSPKQMCCADLYTHTHIHRHSYKHIMGFMDHTILSVDTR